MSQHISVEKSSFASAASTLTALRLRPGRLRTAFLPPLGGSPAPYLGLLARLGRRGPVYGIRALGLEAGEKPDTAIPVMAERYAESLAALPAPADLMVGWSLGGVLAYETALRAPAGHTPDLVLIDGGPGPRTDRPDLYRDIRERVLNEAAGRLDVRAAENHRRTVDAHLQAFFDYEPPSHRYGGRALLMACTSGIDPRQAEAWARLVPDLTVHAVEADHFNALTAPNLSTVAAHIDEFLAVKTG